MPWKPPFSAFPASGVFAKTRTPLEACQRRAPVRVGRGGRVVDVRVADAERGEAAERVRDRLRRSAGPRLDVERDVQARGLGGRDTEGSRASSTEPGPHHETITVSTPIPAISRICARTIACRPTNTARGRGRSSSRSPVAARSRPGPSAPTLRPRSASRTRRSRRSRPAASAGPWASARRRRSPAQASAAIAAMNAARRIETARILLVGGSEKAASGGYAATMSSSVRLDADALRLGHPDRRVGVGSTRVT